MWASPAFAIAESSSTLGHLVFAEISVNLITCNEALRAFQVDWICFRRRRGIVSWCHYARGFQIDLHRGL